MQYTWQCGQVLPILGLVGLLSWLLYKHLMWRDARRAEEAKGEVDSVPPEVEEPARAQGSGLRLEQQMTPGTARTVYTHTWDLKSGKHTSGEITYEDAMRAMAWSLGAPNTSVGPPLPEGTVEESALRDAVRERVLGGPPSAVDRADCDRSIYDPDVSLALNRIRFRHRAGLPMDSLAEDAEDQGRDPGDEQPE
ncbi:MAG TPA: hypothetical protein VEX13_01050 [Chloroflexia bacterium]|nr:hypothetical protein [Chloroflexia bacterium]